MSLTFDNVELLAAVVGAAERPLTVTELAAAVNLHLDVSHLDGRWVARQVERSNGRLRLAADGTVEVVAREPRKVRVLDPAGPGRALRFVALDFETLPRHAGDGTLERVPLQAGALRFGADKDWVNAHVPYECLVSADTELTTIHPDHLLLAEAATDGAPTEQVGFELAGVLAGADIVVAYNGLEVDFPVLDRLLAAAGTRLDALGVVAVDALYLGHALLPDRSLVTIGGAPRGAHELQSLAHRLDHQVDQAHTALSDCELLAEVLRRLARRYARLDERARGLLAAVTRGSYAWALMHDLAFPGEQRQARAAEDARAGVEALLGHLPALRSTEPDDENGPPQHIDVDGLRHEGRVDAFELAALINPGAERRDAQDATARYVDAALTSCTDTLVEAPTGSGKSLVLLAAALDWISADPRRRAVISTYTRALQSQLARDLERLAERLPGLEESVDLVKGSANRLSLRALSSALVGLAGSAPFRYGLSHERASDPAFQELVAYLTLRLDDLSAGRSLHGRWQARSVDRDELPAAFDRFTDGRIGGLLLDLSQGRSGDYAVTDDAPLAAMTVRVREALSNRRLIIANHALLCSASSVFEDMAESRELLLLVDEAHELEAAATSTLSATLATRDLERLRSDLASLAATVDASLTAAERGSTEGEAAHAAAFVGAVGRLHEAIEEEPLPQTLAAVFSIRAGTEVALTRAPRQVVVAESEADLGQLRNASRLEPAVRLLFGRLASVASSLEQVRGRIPRERLDELTTTHARLTDALTALAALSEDLAELTGADAAGHSLETIEQLGLVPENDAPTSGQGSNRVVWASELEMRGRELVQFLDSGMRLRFWPVELTTTPVAVTEDERFARFRTAFAVTVFVSGTLRVPGADDPWQFIRDRLGLDEHCSYRVVDTDFKPAEQAELVAFSDFPSWAEQAEAAIATVAWQVDRYAREVVTDGRHGAMVLTTSRAHAGAIADQLVGLRRPQDTFELHDTRLVGNQRGMEGYTARGGVLIGTRGLWQGVDVPAERVRMVWINKLPFPTVGDPVRDTRRARIETAARDEGHTQPDLAARERYYLPLAAMALRQAVGRLLRSTNHRGVVVISDAKLSGDTALRRLYRRYFLASLPGYATDGGDGEPGDGNVCTMEEGWRRIWNFLATPGVDPLRSPAAIDDVQRERLTADEQLREHVWLPHTRRVLDQMLDDGEVDEIHRQGRLTAELLSRACEVGGALKLIDGPLESLRDAQTEAITAITEGRDVLALLPTGYGKSFLFQLPGLILPGVTIVISPLVSLMTDQALALNRTVGGRVRALTGTMAESNSRLGKAQVAQQIAGDADHGIKIVYLAPERFASTQFQELVRRGVRSGIVRRIAFDEAHTLASWGDTFRPDMRRAEHYVRRLREDYDGAPQLLAVTATATRSVRRHLTRNLFACADVQVVQANPVRADMAVYKRLLPTRGAAGEDQLALLVERLLEVSDGHAIVYTATVKESERLHGFLAAQLGRRRRVLKYHGQLDRLERNSVSSYFATAPSIDDPDGFEPMVVVATKAFGLGIDRDDIRLVVAASPPGDLAELYQALGRAGRDQADAAPSEDLTPTHGVALLTPAAWSMLQFLNRHDRDNDRLVRRFVDAFRTADSPLDLDQLISDVIDERVTRGEVSPQQASRYRDRLEDTYRALAVRTFAALADAGTLEDLGNSPAGVTITPTPRTFTESSDAARQAAAVASVITEEEQRDGVALTDLFDRFEPDTLEGIGDVASLWFELLAFDAAGLLDVKQITADGEYRTQINFRRLSSHWLDDTRLVAELAQLQRERTEDLQRLREWFINDEDCLLEGIGEYFAVVDWQRGACEHGRTRCSNCWQQPSLASHPRGPMLDALYTDTRELAAGAAKVQRHALRRLDRTVAGLLADAPRGVGRAKLRAALRGEPTVFGYGGQIQRVPWGLLRSRHFAQARTVTAAQLDASLDRLIAQGVIVRQGTDPRVWFRHSRHVEAGDA